LIDGYVTFPYPWCLDAEFETVACSGAGSGCGQGAPERVDPGGGSALERDPEGPARRTALPPAAPGRAVHPGLLLSSRTALRGTGWWDTRAAAGAGPSAHRSASDGRRSRDPVPQRRSHGRPGGSACAHPGRRRHVRFSPLPCEAGGGGPGGRGLPRHASVVSRNAWNRSAVPPVRCGRAILPHRMLLSPTPGRSTLQCPSARG
jgi:hypothetical protein